MTLMRSISYSLLPAVALSSSFLYAASTRNDVSTSAEAIITVQQSRGADSVTLSAEDVKVYQGKTPVQVTSLQALRGEHSGMQLFIYLDESTGSSVLGTRLPELKSFVRALPATTQVGIGYMRNGGFSLAQPFTTDHNEAVDSIRLSQGLPGINGSPYFALSYLAKHWPSKDPVERRAVLMLTDGVDRYYDNTSNYDPYVDAAIKDAQHLGILVYSIYLRGSGLYPAGTWNISMGQSRLDQLCQATGGQAYFEGLTSPVSLTPYLDKLNKALGSQYKVTFVATDNRGLQKLVVKTEVPAVKIIAPQQFAAINRS
jgi:hypothetical protein